MSKEIPTVDHRDIQYGDKKAVLWYMNCKVFAVCDKEKIFERPPFDTPEEAWAFFNELKEIPPSQPPV